MGFDAGGGLPLVRLLDMGFEPDIMYIVEKIKAATSSKYQTVLVSATLSKGVQKLSTMSMRSPLFVGLESDGTEGAQAAAIARGDTGGEGGPSSAALAQQVPENLSQSYLVTDSRNRLTGLLAFLHWKLVHESCKCVVFVSTCDSVDFHAEFLREVRPPVSTSHAGAQQAHSGVMLRKEEGQLLGEAQVFQLHGKMPQAARSEAFKQFSARKGSCVLICTVSGLPCNVRRREGDPL